MTLPGFYRAVAQKNEVQLRFNYIGNHYGQVFDDWDWYLFGKPDEKALNSHLFRYEDETEESINGQRYYNAVYYRYHYGGLSFKRDSVFGNWFVRFRIDRFYLNIKTEQEGTRLTNAYLFYMARTNTTRSSMQYTASIGKSLHWKKVHLNIGAEVPLYFRKDAEYQGASEKTDFLGNYITDASYYFVPGGFFTGLSLFAGIGVDIGERFAITIEDSAGLIYIKQNGKNETIFTLHYPSVGFSYRF